MSVLVLLLPAVLPNRPLQRPPNKPLQRGWHAPRPAVETVEKLRYLFSDLDTNRDGYLDPPELSVIPGINTTVAIDKYDTDGDGLLSPAEFETLQADTKKLQVTHTNIPGKLDDRLAEDITAALERFDAPAWVREINYAHLTNVLLNMITLAVFTTCAHSLPNAEADVIFLSTIILQINLLGLMYDNTVLAFGRTIESPNGPIRNAVTLVKQATKLRVRVHSFCVATLALPIVAIGWDDGVFGGASVAPWMVLPIAFGILASSEWDDYDLEELTEVHDEDAVAQDRGVYSFSTRRVLQMVGPAVAVCMLMLAVGGMSICDGDWGSGALMVLGSSAMLSSASFRVQALDNYAETFMYAMLSAAFVLADFSHLHDVARDDVLGLIFGI